MLTNIILGALLILLTLWLIHILHGFTVKVRSSVMESKLADLRQVAAKLYEGEKMDEKRVKAKINEISPSSLSSNSRYAFQDTVYVIENYYELKNGSDEQQGTLKEKMKLNLISDAYHKIKTYNPEMYEIYDIDENEVVNWKHRVDNIMDVQLGYIQIKSDCDQDNLLSLIEETERIIPKQMDKYWSTKKENVLNF